MQTLHASVPAPGTKILFACFPADGHFNPLTGLASHLMSIGCDVRWYTSKHFVKRIEKLNIPYFLFQKAKEVDTTRLDEEFPERKRKGKIDKLNFDLINIFISRSPEYYEDLQDIHKQFAFELVVCDIAFTGIPFVTEKMNIPVVSVGIVPLPETSKDLAPYGLGMTPSYTNAGRIKQACLRLLAGKVLFAKSTKFLKTTLAQYDLDSEGLGVFDICIRKSTKVLQIGSPQFEYDRSDMSANVEFVGALLPYSQKKAAQWYHEKLSRYKKIILATQGTVEKDINKLVVPALEAFKETDALLIVTTGGSHTEALRQRYPYDNILIEDFIPFNDVMPYADVYITNGGYGGVLLSVTNNLPLVVAGIHEGKNEINARVGYFELGVDLKTETPSVLQLRMAVEQVMNNSRYADNIQRLCKELAQYNPLKLCTEQIANVLKSRRMNMKVIGKDNKTAEAI